MRVVRMVKTVTVEVPREVYPEVDDAFWAANEWVANAYNTEKFGYVSEEEDGPNYLITFEIEEYTL